MKHAEIADGVVSRERIYQTSVADIWQNCYPFLHRFPWLSSGYVVENPLFLWRRCGRLPAASRLLDPRAFSAEQDGKKRTPLARALRLFSTFGASECIAGRAFSLS